MRFSLPALTASLASLAALPEIAVESSVFASPVEMVKLGSIVIDAGGQSTWIPNPGVTIPVAGLDLHLRADDSLPALAGLPSVTLNCTLDGVAGPSSAIAALAIPSWVADQSKTFPVGQACDFVPQGAGNSAKLVTAIAGVTSTTNLPANVTLSVWGSPASNNFVEIGYKRNADGPYTVPGSVAIADKYNPSAAVKKGRASESKLEMDFVHISAMGGMARYNGSRVSVLIKIIKDKAAYTENIVYTGYRPQASPSRGDGDTEVVEKSSGPFEAFLIFTAG